MGHQRAESIHWSKLTISLTGNTWKTHTQMTYPVILALCVGQNRALGTDLEPAKTSSIMLELTLVVVAMETREMVKVLFPLGLMWSNVDDLEVDYGDQSKGFV